MKPVPSHLYYNVYTHRQGRNHRILCRYLDTLFWYALEDYHLRCLLKDKRLSKTLYEKRSCHLEMWSHDSLQLAVNFYNNTLYTEPFCREDYRLKTQINPLDYSLLDIREFRKIPSLLDDLFQLILIELGKGIGDRVIDEVTYLRGNSAAMRGLVERFRISEDWF